MKQFKMAITILGAIFACAHSAAAQGGVERYAEARRGVSLDLNLTGGEPTVSGGAGDIWDSAGGLGIVPGFGARLGYAWQRFGVQTGFDMTTSNPSDRDGSGIALFILGNWRIAPDSRLNPMVGIGYVRQAISGQFASGEFPLETVTEQPDEYPPFEPGSVTTFANGVRVEVGGSVPITPGSLDMTFGAMGDIMSFPNVEFNGYTHSLLDKGHGFWPRVSIGLRWHP
jgi:hypothetical protein